MTHRLKRVDSSRQEHTVAPWRAMKGGTGREMFRAIIRI